MRKTNWTLVQRKVREYFHLCRPTDGKLMCQSAPMCVLHFPAHCFPLFLSVATETAQGDGEEGKRGRENATPPSVSWHRAQCLHPHQSAFNMAVTSKTSMGRGRIGTPGY